MTKKNLLIPLLLLAILLVAGQRTVAAPPLPPSVPSRSGAASAAGALQKRADDGQRVEATFVVGPDSAWQGEMRLTPSGSHSTQPATDTSLGSDVGVAYNFHLEGSDLQSLIVAAFGEGDSGQWLNGPAVIELHGPVRRGEDLAVILPANPSTGYSWMVETLDQRALAQMGHVETEETTAGFGTMARQTVRLRATDSATAAVRLAYRRAWETHTPAVREVAIEARGLGLADICAALSAALPPRRSDDGMQAVAEQEERNLEQSPPPVSAQDLPTAYNWCNEHGGCPAVRDQGSCGSCWAFATVGPFEAWLRYAHGIAGMDLSEQYLLSCNTDGYSCSGGWFAHRYHLNYAPPGEPEPGAVLESAFPYVARDDPCGGPYAHPYRISSWASVSNNVAAIKQAIYEHGPVAAGICVGSAFQSYRNGIFTTHETCDGGVNHAIVLVGWDDNGGDGYWVLRNSWGPGWGENGYMRIRWGTSSVGYSANYVVYDYIPFVATDQAYLPLAMRAFTPPPAPVTGIRNGDFERGRDGSWRESSSNGWHLVLSGDYLPVPPHGGSWAAWLGGDHDETSILSQEINLPAEAAALGYWYWSASDDYCGYDYAHVRFGSTTLATYDLCQSSNTGGWTYREIDIRSWHGQTVDLRFVVETDGSLISNVFLDDVAIVAAASARPPFGDGFIPTAAQSVQAGRQP